MERSLDEINLQIKEKLEQAQAVNTEVFRDLVDKKLDPDSKEFKEKKKLGNKLLKESQSLLKELKSRQKA